MSPAVPNPNPTATPSSGVASLAQRIDALLPQTQCTRCGYPDCRSYADAIAGAAAPLNRCPPGGAEGIRQLAALLGRPELPLDPSFGDEGPRRIVYIEEATCIGCTLCIQACPVDAIVGAQGRMHTVVEPWCIGCGLCLPPCPVDCIDMMPARGEWNAKLKDAAGQRARSRKRRIAGDRVVSTVKDRKAVLAAALARRKR